MATKSAVPSTVSNEKSLINELAAAVKASGKSQGEISRETGVSQTTISFLVNGKKSQWTPAAQKVADFVGFKVPKIAQRKSEPKKAELKKAEPKKAEPKKTESKVASPPAKASEAPSVPAAPVSVPKLKDLKPDDVRYFAFSGMARRLDEALQSGNGMAQHIFDRMRELVA